MLVSDACVVTFMLESTFCDFSLVVHGPAWLRWLSDALLLMWMFDACVCLQGVLSTNLVEALHGSRRRGGDACKGRQVAAQRRESVKNGSTRRQKHKQLSMTQLAQKKKKKFKVQHP